MSLFNCQKRILWLLTGFFVISALLCGRLFYIQVLNGPMLTKAAVRQRLQGTVLLDGRGDILDRQGRSLIDGRTETGLLAFPAQFGGKEAEIIGSLGSITGIERIETPPYGQLPFWVTPALDGALPAELDSLPGLIPAPKTQRYGPDALASHVVGYLRESEARGVSGIELAFDRELSPGQSTILAAVVDGRSRLIPGLGYRLRDDSGQSALNVTLTIDRDLQQEVEEIMDRWIRQGAVVVMDPWNGDVLAMASRPDFDAAKLTEHLQRDQDSLVNRALSGYQPGSVFKTVVAAAALEKGIATLYQTFRCTGGVTVDGLYFSCTNLHKKREINLVEAFAHSCNSVFINLALELGPQTVSAYARKLGFGTVTGLPIGETAGKLPAAEDLQVRRAVANTAIGQGDVLTTPLQVAVMMASVANGGRSVQPRLVLALNDQYGREVRSFLPRRGGSVLSEATVNKLKFMMHAVIEQGTGRPANTTEAAAGAKTGTAQSGRRDKDGREILNSWIAGFYPLERARAVIVVFADEFSPGGSAARVFGEITRYLEVR